MIECVAGRPERDAFRRRSQIFATARRHPRITSAACLDPPTETTNPLSKSADAVHGVNGPSSLVNVPKREENNLMRPKNGAMTVTKHTASRLKRLRLPSFEDSAGDTPTRNCYLGSTMTRRPLCTRLAPLFTAIALLAAPQMACSRVMLISNYDEQIDQSSTTLQKRMDASLTMLAENEGKPSATYDANRSFYTDYAVDLRSLTVRAESWPKNQLTEQQLTLMGVNLEPGDTDVRHCHPAVSPPDRGGPGGDRIAPDLPWPAPFGGRAARVGTARPALWRRAHPSGLR
ncbi:MAG: hypothetical protein ABI766_09640 [Gemmatimonadales bacterium]